VSYNASKGGLSIGHEEGSFSPEELVAMVLTHATDITKGYGGLQVKDAVLIAPSFFTQTERQVRSKQTQHTGETGGEAKRQAGRRRRREVASFLSSFLCVCDCVRRCWMRRRSLV
jgi:hypothetical protein